MQDELFDSLFLHQIEHHDGADHDGADPLKVRNPLRGVAEGVAGKLMRGCQPPRLPRRVGRIEGGRSSVPATTLVPKQCVWHLH